MQVTVNSQALELPDHASVADLVVHLGLPATRVAVELNRQLVRRAEHANTPLSAGDRVEVVTLVGGGSVRRIRHTVQTDHIRHQRRLGRLV